MAVGNNILNNVCIEMLLTLLKIKLIYYINNYKTFIYLPILYSVFIN